MRRLRTITALVSVALVTLDLVFSVLGHSHEHSSARHPGPHAQADSSCHVAHGCGHHHGPCSKADEERPMQPSPEDEHGDCSLCRHFQQPVVAVSISLALVGCERVTAVVAAANPRFCTVVSVAYPARGPPLV